MRRAPRRACRNPVTCGFKDEGVVHARVLECVGCSLSKMVRLRAPSNVPRWLAWASVTLICSLFYLVAFTTSVALALLAFVPTFRLHAATTLAILLVLSSFPNRPWHDFHRRLGTLWFDIFQVQSDVPELVDGERYLFVISPQ